MSKIDQIHLRPVMLYMSKMSKIDQIHLRVYKIDQIHLRAVMLCMLKMSKMGKEHTDTFFNHTFLNMVSFECNAIYVKDVEDRSNTPKGCNAMYVEDVKVGKHTHTFLLITSLIFNGFSI